MWRPLDLKNLYIHSSTSISGCCMYRETRLLRLLPTLLLLIFMYIYYYYYAAVFFFFVFGCVQTGVSFVPICETSIQKKENPTEPFQMLCSACLSITIGDSAAMDWQRNYTVAPQKKEKRRVCMCSLNMRSS